MGVKINRGMPRPEAPAASVPRDQWRDLAIVREMWAKSQLPFDCRLLRQVAADAPLMAPELGYADADTFMREELALDPTVVRALIRCFDRSSGSPPASARDRKRKQRGTDLTPRPCACCGAVFTPKRTDARFCGGACRARASRQAKAQPET